MAERAKPRIIITDKLLQRGQILTWPRERKHKWLEEYGIDVVVNFWPKVDPDMADAPIDWYLFIPAAQSIQMLEPKIEVAAIAVANMIDAGKTALIMCEAGVTRSVFFSILVVAELEGMDLPDALEFVEGKLNRVKLKGFMHEYIEDNTFCSLG